MTALTVRCHSAEIGVGKLEADADCSCVGSAPIYGDLMTGSERTVIFAYRDVAEVTSEVSIEGPFRAFEVEGPLDFSLTGVLASLLNPLAAAEISVFTLSTFDTDWILVPSGSIDAAARALEADGHTTITEESS